MFNTEDSTAFARSGETGAFGKLDAELPTIRIASETQALLQVRAAQAGVSISEYVRTHLEVHVHGLDHVRSLQEQKLQRIVGNAAGMPRAGAAS